MRKKIPFLMVFLLIISLLSPSLASFSPTWDGLSQGPVQAELSRFVLSDFNVSDEALSVVQNELDPLSCVLALCGDTQSVYLYSTSSLILSFGGENLADISSPAEEIKGFMNRLLPRIYALLSDDEHVTYTSKSISLKQAGTSKKQIVYTYETEEANELLPGLHELLSGEFGSQTAEGTLDAYLQSYLANFTFCGKLTVKQLQDSNGNDLGVSVSATVCLEGSDKRTLKLTYGSGASGGLYLSLSALPSRGNNKLSLSLNYGVTSTKNKNTLEYSYSFTHRLDDETVSRKIEAELTDSTKSGEKISGSVKCTSIQNDISTVYIITPSLKAVDETLQGTVSLTKKVDKQTIYTISCELILQEAGQAEAAQILLSDTEDEQGLATLGNQLLTYFLSRLNQLSSRQQALLLHTLHTDSWLNGSTVQTTDDYRSEGEDTQ